MSKKKTNLWIVPGVLLLALACENPFFYGDPATLGLIDNGWGYFESHQYDLAIPAFTQALTALETDSSLLVDQSKADAHAGLGWSFLRSGVPDIALENFQMSQELGLYNFGISVGLMSSCYELRETNPGLVDLAIETGEWVLESGMAPVFEHDPAIGLDQAQILIAQSYYFKGDLGQTKAMIIAINSFYNYIDENNSGTWNLAGAANSRDYDSFAELLLAILMNMESVYPV